MASRPYFFGQAQCFSAEVNTETRFQKRVLAFQLIAPLSYN